MLNDKGNEMIKATFLSAVDGKLVAALSGGAQVIMHGSDEVAVVAKFVDFSEIMCSSSMDFADEYGFSHASGAWEMFNRAFEAA